MNQEERWEKEYEEFRGTLPGYARSGFSRSQGELVYLSARKKAQDEIDNYSDMIHRQRQREANLNLELEKRDRLLDEAYKSVSGKEIMGCKEEAEWLKQYEEMRGEK